MGTKADIGFDDAEGGFAAIPKGRYVARLDSVSEEDSSAGNPMLVWDWSVVGGTYHGKELRSWTSLLPQAIGIGCKEHFQAFGGRWSAGDVLVAKARGFLGKRASLFVTQFTRIDRESGDERISNKVSNVFPLQDDSGAGSTPAAAASASVNNSNPITHDDDIPF